MILLNDVIHVLTGSTLALARQELFVFEIAHGSDVSGVLVDVDYPWGGDMGCAQHFSEETLGCSRALLQIIELIFKQAG